MQSKNQTENKETEIKMKMKEVREVERSMTNIKERHFCCETNYEFNRYFKGIDILTLDSLIGYISIYRAT